MKRHQLLQRLDAAWVNFQNAYAGLSHNEMTAPGVVEDWSVKDVIAHVTTWEEEALHHLPTILAGQRTPRYSVAYGGIDAFNAEMTAKKRALSLPEILAQRDDTHRRLIAYIATIPEAEFVTETRVRRRIRYDTYSHYPIHTRAIWEWRERRASGDG
jgi:hypothetical protein